MTGLAAAPKESPARVRAAHAPVLGDWEGSGPEGLPLSFELFRAGGRVAVRDLTVGDPLRCPGRFAPTDAFGYAQTTYIGPGAPPRLRFLWRPDEVWIRVGMGAPFSPELRGHLSNARSVTLSEPAPTGEPPGCGWSSKQLTWHVAPARRTPVQPGLWTGTVSTAGGTGTVSVRVAPSGRVVELFESDIACTAGGGGSSEIGPAPVGEFISAGGDFEDADRPAGFNGHFEPGGELTGTLTGSFAQGCGGSLPFTAHPG